ncbi:hypothetical protein GI584_16105 [Gracilibacillus salitolerans]|uniref:Uncharacterized protein n=1 Tax=Gracilibacillus salitolerans TaxID=2663022 RepID=A0A5Q2TKK2_9BACI|nr:hypothetical protein [Gracilibacillus salitolerans]QGH35479.1 hypothetical protein GI584_16105 [Gracilibacillus salitolerans]
MDKKLSEFDQKITWKGSSRQRVKRMIDEQITASNKKRMPPLSVIFSMIAVALLFILIIGSFSETIQHSSDRMIHETKEGIAIQITHKKEQADGYQVTVRVQNNSKYKLEQNELFIKDFSGEGEMRTYHDEDWSESFENTYVDRNSVILKTQNDWETIEQGQSNDVNFYVPKEFVESDEYEVIYHSVSSIEPGQRGGEDAGEAFHVIDLLHDQVGLYQHEITSNENTPFIIIVVITTIIVIILIMRYVHVTPKWKLGISGLVLVATLFIFPIRVAVMDDEAEITQLTEGILPITELVHLESIDNDRLIAFYQSGGGSSVSFGNVFVEKTWFGWKNRGGGAGVITNTHQIGWSETYVGNSNSNFSKPLIDGLILNEDIEEVIVETNKGEVEATIAEYPPNERFYFLLLDSADVNVENIYGVGEEGEIIEAVW